MTKKVFEFSNYKDFLREAISSKGRGMVKRLADAAGCQRSYLSQALGSHVNLSAEHLCGIGIFLQLKENEVDYLLLLLENEKASLPTYQQRIQRKLEDLRKKNQRLSKRVMQTPDHEINEKYYSAWYYSALHIATSIEHLKSEVHFSNYLSLPINVVSSVLRELESWQLVCFENGSWNYRGGVNLHLDDQSLLTRMNHLNWRSQSLSRPLSPNRDVHYTSVFTIAKKDIEILREQLLSFIDQQRRRVGESESEELISFCCDFFHVSG